MDAFLEPREHVMRLPMNFTAHYNAELFLFYGIAVCFMSKLRYFTSCIYKVSQPKAIVQYFNSIFWGLIKIENLNMKILRVFK